MRCFRSALPFVVALIVLLVSALQLDAADKLKVVVITGGHGFDAKTFPEWFAGHDDLEITITGGKKGDPKIFDNIENWPYDVMVLYNLRQKLNDTQKKNFLALLERKVGLVVLHHAIAAYNEWWEYPKIMGATYLLKAGERDGVKYARPTWKHGVDIKVHVEDKTHPITKGIEDFTVNDETYLGWTYHEGNHLLLTTDEKLNNKQLAWTRDYKGAKVFFFQLGHAVHAYRDKNCKLIVARAIRWTAGKPVNPE